MIQPQSVPGSTAARAGETQVPPRPGQVPGGTRPLARLCILSVAARRAGEGVDWDATEAELRRLAALGFGLGLGLDPAERADLGPEALAELVRRAGKLALPQGFVAGASSEPVGATAGIGLQLQALTAQASAIEEAGGVPLLLPLAALSRRRAREEEYVEVHRALLARMGGPVLLDWTGPELRPELYDYFPGRSFERILALEPSKVRGARYARLDVTRETRLRRELLTRDQLLFTADRAHLARLLLGANPGPAELRLHEPTGHTELAGVPVALGDFSHALLSGATGEAETLAVALERLAAGDVAGFVARLEPRR